MGGGGIGAAVPLVKCSRLDVVSTRPKTGNAFATSSSGITFMEIAVDTDDVGDWHI